MDEATSSGRKRYLLWVTFFAVIVMAAIAFFLAPSQMAEYYYAKGEEAFMNNNYGAAVGSLQKATFFDSKEMKTEALLGRSIIGHINTDPALSSEVRTKLYREALNHLDKATSLGIDSTYEDYATFLADHGLANLETGNEERAVEILEGLIKEFPKTAPFWARLILARDYINHSNKPQEAIEVLAPILENPETTNSKTLIDTYVLMTRLSTYFEKPTEAEKFAKLIVDLAPSTAIDSLAYAYIHLAGAYSRKGDVETALKWIAKAEELKGSGGYECLRANIYYQNGKTDLAFTAAQKQEHPICWSILGQIYFKRGQQNDAEHYIEKALSALKIIRDKDIFTIDGIKKDEEILSKIKAAAR